MPLVHSANFFLWPQSTHGAFPGTDIWVLETEESHKKPNLANTMAEQWLLFRVKPKIQLQSGWDVTAHYRRLASKHLLNSISGIAFKAFFD